MHCPRLILAPNLTDAHLINMLKFRKRNHKFPTESGRWNNIEFADRKCELCTKNDKGDNYHYLLICPFFKNIRKLHIDP